MDRAAAMAAFFRRDPSVAALHVRRRWLGDLSPGLRAKVAARVARITSVQGSDGSWGGSHRQTISALYSLWLLGARRSRVVTRGVRWLLSHRPHTLAENRCRQDIAGTPFTKGCANALTDAPVMYLASVFGMAAKPEVRRLYERYERVVRERNGHWCKSPSCFNAFFQAFCVHPDYAKSRGMRLGVRRLLEARRADSAWRSPWPLYAIVNGLSRVRLPAARQALKKAAARLSSMRNADGTWGRSDRALKTFLVLDALERSGVSL